MVRWRMEDGAPPFRLRVRVTPRGGRDAIDGVEADGTVRARVAAAPADGRANEALVRLIAGALAVPASRVTIVSGAAARVKMVEIEGMARDVALERLRRGG